MIKSKLSTEFIRLKSIKRAEDLYWIFFRLVQIFLTVSTVYFLLFSLPLILSISAYGNMGFLISPFWVAGPLCLDAVQIILAEAALSNDFTGMV